MTKRVDILSGICSWTDRSLIRSGFYPKGVSSPASRLSYCAELFRVIEADSTFYAPLDAGTALRWIAGTPSNFMFGIKSFALFTWHRARYGVLPRWLRDELGERPAESLVSRSEVSHRSRVRLFEELAAPVRILHDAGRLAYLLFQFPPTFKFSRESLIYLRRVREIAGRLPIAVEVRHASWYEAAARDKFFDMLEHLNIAYTAVDEPSLDWCAPPVMRVTCGWGALVRFHGRNVAAWSDRRAAVAERFKYLYERSELEEWCERVREAERSLRDGGRIYLMFNNCVDDFAPRGAAMIMELLGCPVPRPRQKDLVGDDV